MHYRFLIWNIHLNFPYSAPPWVPGDFHQFILNLPLGGRHVRLFLNISTSICKVQFLSLFSPGRERTIGSSRPFLRWNRCGRGLWPLEKENSWLRKHLSLPFILKLCLFTRHIGMRHLVWQSEMPTSNLHCWETTIDVSFVHNVLVELVAKHFFLRFYLWAQLVWGLRKPMQDMLNYWLRHWSD